MHSASILKRLRMPFHLIIPTVTLLCLSGCIGAVVSKDYLSVWDSQKPDAGNVCHANDEREIGPCTPVRPEELTLQQLLKLWGKPEKNEVSGDLRIITYNSGIAWRGVTILAIILPIPISVPTGHDEITFYFRDEQLVRVESTGSIGSMTACGYIVAGFQFGFQCVVDGQYN